jgi:hypothetical protein
MTTEANELDINPDEIGVEVSRMWVRLARLYAGAVSDIFIDGKYEDAMRVAWLAEAAYWQAGGHGENATVSRIIKLPEAQP